MKPLAGGLLCEGKAFPPYQRFSHESVQLTATDILRHILRHPEVCGVVPGTASVAEAEENAQAGHFPIELAPQRLAVIEQATHEMRTSLCSRCGLCDTLCSQSLPVSWLFRDAYISNYPSETFETLDRLQYFHLHPDETATCRTCRDVTCHCPYDIDIPGNLIRIHQQMVSLREQGLLPATPEQLQNHRVEGAFPAQVVSYYLPASLQRGQGGVCRVYVHNAGTQTWMTSRVVLAVLAAGKLEQQVRLRHDVPPGTRTHFIFTITTGRNSGDSLLQFLLMSPSTGAISDDATPLLTATLSVTEAPLVPLTWRLHTFYRQARERLRRQIRLLFTTAS